MVQYKLYNTIGRQNSEVWIVWNRQHMTVQPPQAQQIQKIWQQWLRLICTFFAHQINFTETCASARSRKWSRLTTMHRMDQFDNTRRGWRGIISVNMLEQASGRRIFKLVVVRQVCDIYTSVQSAHVCTVFNVLVNSLRPRQNGRHFADDTFKCIFLNENVRIAIKNSLKFVPRRPIYNIPALVQIMAWRRPGDKPLSEPMMVRLLTHICVTRPQWVNSFWLSDAIDLVQHWLR